MTLADALKVYSENGLACPTIETVISIYGPNTLCSIISGNFLLSLDDFQNTDHYSTHYLSWPDNNGYDIFIIDLRSKTKE